MSSESKVDVLIVGAGPTGLVLAILLKMRGIRCRVIDKLPKLKETSRSFTIHARTIEMFDQIGLADAFLQDGILNEGFIFNFKGKDIKPTLDFKKLDSTHSYIVIQSQNNTEKLFRDHLYKKHGLAPEWSTELVDLKTGNREKPSVTIKHLLDGTEEVLEPEWVIGCDGAHSFVRQVNDLDFTGSSYEGMVLQMMDVDINGFSGSENLVHYYISKESFLLLAKLPGQGHRVLISMMGEGDPALSKREEFQQLVDGHVPGVTLGEPTWTTKWTIHKRLAERYRNRRVFLAGDAVHIHSPTGGQGMNVGLQDVYNLAWKLALVIQGKAKEALLDTYEVERMPIGEQVIVGTDAMHNVIMAHGKGMQDRLEITQRPGWHDEAVNRISGLSYHYRGCASLPEKLELPGELQAGDRAPDVSMPGGGRLFDLLKHTGMTMLLVAKEAVSSGDVEKAREEIESKFGDVIKMCVVEAEDGPFVQRYGCGGDDFACLIRPDGYISLRCKLGDAGEAASYLETWLETSTKQLATAS